METTQVYEDQDQDPARLESNIDIERFDIDKEIKIQKQILKVFEESENILSERQILDLEYVAIVDIPHVCMLVAKTDKAKILLRRFYNPDIKPKPINEEILLGENRKGNSIYSLDYLVRIFSIFNTFQDKYDHGNDHVRIKIGTDTPAILENEHIKIYLAPRLEDY